jgi:heptosyltransferase-2
VSPISRILIRLPNWLGDALMARPLLHELARRFPGAERLAVGPRPLLDLLAVDGAFERAEAWPPPSGVSRSEALRRMRAFAPDLAVVLPPSFSSAWLAWRSGARERIGFAHEARSVLLTRAVRRPARGEQHLADEYCALLEPELGNAPAAPELRLTVESMRRADEILAALGAGGTRIAVLGPGALYGPAKRWPGERFADLARRLRAQGLTVLVCGAPAEAEACAAVALTAGVESLAGRTDLQTQAGLCARAALAVCNDSGLAHLAAAVGTPTVALFGSTSSAWSAPRGARVRIVQHAPVCSPCFRRTCRIGYRCLIAIEVGEVERACRELAA